MSILPVGIGPQEGGYQIERSLRFNSADSAYLSRTPASAGNRKTWTWSGWVKRSGFGVDDVNLFSAYASISNYAYFGFRYAATPGYETLEYFDSNNNFVTTTQVFRDPSAWYHLIIAFDTTQATAANRIKVYVNGTQVTAFSRTAYPTQNTDGPLNQAIGHNLGRWPYTPVYLNGYLTEINFIDGSALDPTSFGEFNSETGVWQPKAYTGSYGTNGFYLDFADNSSTTALGYDAAGSNDWTPNNFSVTAGAGNDSLVDTPTPYGTDTGVGGEVRGNYATWNPLDKTSTISLTNGNLDVSLPANVAGGCGSTFSVSSGKWYWEIVSTSGSALIIGIVPSSKSLIGANDLFTVGYGYYQGSGNKYVNGVGSAYGASWTTNVIGIAIDLDANTLTFYKDNVSQGAISIAADSYKFTSSNGASGESQAFITNFGQRPFAYTAPSGFKALCTTNLPEPTIADGGEYFNAVTYTGTGSAQSITGVGFQPDLVWLKARSNAYTHVLVDSIRGTDKVLVSASTGAENTTNSGEDFTAFNSDGFSVGTPVNFNSTNANGATIVGWNWKANGAGVTNTAGTITSTVSANTTAGFSIVTYTGNGTDGASVGHGLVDKAPSMIIIKNRTDSTSAFWCVYHKSAYVSSTDPNVLYLNSTQAQTDDTNVWGSSPEFSSTIFKLGDYNGSNGSADNLVAYCFAPVEGYSAFGSYTGNGSSDGPFVYLGFRPKYLLVKSSSTGGAGYDWIVCDGVRNTYNAVTRGLYANLSDAEDNNNRYDFLANGFKIRNTFAELNGSGVTYIYAAFAEVPMKFALGR